MFKTDGIRIWKREDESIFDPEYILNPDFLDWEKDFVIRINGIMVYRYEAATQREIVLGKQVRKLLKKLRKHLVS